MQLEKIFEPSNTDYKKMTSSRGYNFKGYFVSAKRLVKGNSKLHNILIFDLPAVTTCLNCSDCKANCYAMKAQRQYTDTRIFRNTNFGMYQLDREILKALIVTQLKNAKQTVVRIHSSGDFFSQKYIDFWGEIIRQFPKINFYAYTKVNKILDFSQILCNDNFNLISSLIDNKLNFGSLEYCNELKDTYGTFICPATKGKDVKCGKECSHCVTKSNVCFVQH
jgi:hypothetical protein